MNFGVLTTFEGLLKLLEPWISISISIMSIAENICRIERKWATTGVNVGYLFCCFFIFFIFLNVFMFDCIFLAIWLANYRGKKWEIQIWMKRDREIGFSLFWFGQGDFFNCWLIMDYWLRRRVLSTLNLKSWSLKML